MIPENDSGVNTSVIEETNNFITKKKIKVLILHLMVINQQITSFLKYLKN